MQLNRRRFLQGMGLGILTLALDPYLQGLAAPTARKLALLVGVDHYGDGSLDLKGCVTDVQLQQELLIHRFGFNPQDIVTLTNAEATREAIETAFLEHLVNQAIAGDVVVFHFSGYGHQVQGINALLPSDGLQFPEKIPTQQDILETTLDLLGRSLATDKVTMILDTSYQGGAKFLQGNLRSRSFPLASEVVNPQELAFQAQLSSRKAKISKKRPGMVLLAANPSQSAAEIRGNGWNAGLFTYSLTQYLWQVSPASQVMITLARSSEPVERIRGLEQQPQLLKNTPGARLTYFLPPESPQGADGVITEIDAQSSLITVFLAGLPPLIVDYFGVNSTFDVLQNGEIFAKIQVQSRQGLKAKAINLTPDQPLQVGQRVQESRRVLPKDMKLFVTPDSSLSRIERVDATSAISSIEGVVVSPEKDTRADILLSRQGTGYGLSTLGGFLLTDTPGPEDEAIKSALGRLKGKFQTLLAAKYWHLTLNEGSSRLKVGVGLEKIAQSSQTVIYKQTRPGAIAACSGSKLSDCPQGLSPSLLSGAIAESSLVAGLPKLSVGTAIAYRIENYESEPIYYLIVGLDTRTKAIALVSPTNLAIPPGQSQRIPDTSTEPLERITAPVGLGQMYVICSKVPFTRTQGILDKEKEGMLVTLSDPLSVARAILEDLNQAQANPSESYALDLNQWATLSFMYQVIN
jgi:hypothetical protein